VRQSPLSIQSLTIGLQPLYPLLFHLEDFPFCGRCSSNFENRHLIVAAAIALVMPFVVKFQTDVTAVVASHVGWRRAIPADLRGNLGLTLIENALSGI
jgi:hypothetical protein